MRKNLLVTVLLTIIGNSAFCGTYTLSQSHPSYEHTVQGGLGASIATENSYGISAERAVTIRIVMKKYLHVHCDNSSLTPYLNGKELFWTMNADKVNVCEFEASPGAVIRMVADAWGPKISWREPIYTTGSLGVDILGYIDHYYDLYYSEFTYEISLKKCSVTYDPGANGSGTRRSAVKEPGETLTLRNATFTRTGYRQTGWSTADGGTKAYDFGMAYSADKDLTLYPYWEANAYSISYSLDGGSHGVAHPTYAAYDGIFFVSAPSHPELMFAGWSVTSGLNAKTARWGTSSSSVNAEIADSTEKCKNGAAGDVYFKNLTATDGGSVTLTAKWKTRTYKVLYKPGKYGSEYSCSGNKIQGEPLTLLGRTFTRSGYSQIGWSTSDGGAKIYDLGASYAVDADMTLYPYWAKNETGPDGLTIAGGVLVDYDGSVSSVTIPSSVLCIGEGAFKRGAKSLRELTIPSSVARIECKAFDGCKNLTRVNITDLAKWCAISFGDITATIKSSWHLYQNSTEVQDMVLPDGVKSIGDYAFYNCIGLKSVTIPSGVTRIGDYAFGHCIDLTSVTIPSSVTSIGNYAFADCFDLTSVTIPSSVTNVGDHAFYDCSGLKSVTIPSNVTDVGYLAFFYCSGLADAEGFVIVGDVLYSYYGNATSVVIPFGVKKIGECAFCTNFFPACSNITSVTIPSSVTSIGMDDMPVTTIEGRLAINMSWPFSGCASLSEIFVERGDVERVKGLFQIRYGEKPVPYSFVELDLPSKTYEVCFDPNGGAGTMPPQTFIYDETQELLANAFTRKGWRFAGWATSADGEVKYADGATVKNLAMSGTVTLYAKWKTNYVVTINANGGGGVMARQTFDLGRVYKLPKCTLTPPAGKSRFVGWAGSNGKRYDDEMLVFDLGDITMTAIWQ